MGWCCNVESSIRYLGGGHVWSGRGGAGLQVLTWVATRGQVNNAVDEGRGKGVRRVRSAGAQQGLTGWLHGAARLTFVVW